MLNLPVFVYAAVMRLTKLPPRVYTALRCYLEHF